MNPIPASGAASEMNGEGILSALKPCGTPWRLELHDEATSTNDLAKEAGLRSEHGGLVVCAESQTSGRGQRSNRWITPRGNDLMFSVLLRPTQPVELWPRLTTLAAVAVCRAIEEVLPVQAGVKWPNDILLNGRKVSGLLAETTIGGGGMFVVLGVGINVNTTVFPEEISTVATSLLRELGATPLPCLEREPVLAAFLNALGDLIDSGWESGFPEVLMEVRQRSVLVGRSIRALVDGQPVQGRVRDLNHEGHLVLERLDGRTELLTSAAEVRVV